MQGVSQYFYIILIICKSFSLTILKYMFIILTTIGIFHAILIILKVLGFKGKCDFEVFSGEKLLLNEYTGIRKKP